MTRLELILSTILFKEQKKSSLIHFILYSVPVPQSIRTGFVNHIIFIKSMFKLYIKIACKEKEILIKLHAYMTTICTNNDYVELNCGKMLIMLNSSEVRLCRHADDIQTTTIAVCVPLSTLLPFGSSTIISNCILLVGQL